MNSSKAVLSALTNGAPLGDEAYIEVVQLSAEAFGGQIRKSTNPDLEALVSQGTFTLWMRMLRELRTSQRVLVEMAERVNLLKWDPDSSALVEALAAHPSLTEPARLTLLYQASEMVLDDWARQAAQNPAEKAATSANDKHQLSRADFAWLLETLRAETGGVAETFGCLAAETPRQSRRRSRDLMAEILETARAL